MVCVKLLKIHISNILTAQSSNPYVCGCRFVPLGIFYLAQFGTNHWFPPLSWRSWLSRNQLPTLWHTGMSIPKTRLAGMLFDPNSKKLRQIIDQEQDCRKPRPKIPRSRASFCVATRRFNLGMACLETHLEEQDSGHAGHYLKSFEKRLFMVMVYNHIKLEGLFHRCLAKTVKA